MNGSTTYTNYIWSNEESNGSTTYKNYIVMRKGMGQQQTKTI